MFTTHFTDREHGLPLPAAEVISAPLRRALLVYIQVGIDNGSYGWRFAKRCPDGHVACGTDERAFWDSVAGEIPDLRLPDNALFPQAVQSAADVDTAVVLDLLEFCAAAVAQPTQLAYHRYHLHHHLEFDRDAGLIAFVEHVNGLFLRNGVAFELTGEGAARRLGAPGLREELVQAEFNTGDDEADRLLGLARERIVSPSEDDRRDAIEKLWDAFERIKTLEHGANKREQADRLLDRTAEASQLRTFLGEEAQTLTTIGNRLGIRHAETTQERIETPEQIDYLFHRLFSFLRLVLRATGRGA